MDDCQLERLPDAGAELGARERLLLRTAKRIERFSGGRIRLPIIAIDAARHLDVEPATPPAPRRPPLHLEAGEQIRVRSLAEIRATLDAKGRCGGLGFMPVMERFAGRTFVVRKRIDRFFDERSRKLLKVKGVVILDGVLCEVPHGDAAPYGGCDRSCFLFWKEDWLERANAAGQERAS